MKDLIEKFWETIKELTTTKQLLIKQNKSAEAAHLQTIIDDYLIFIGLSEDSSTIKNNIIDTEQVEQTLSASDPDRIYEVELSCEEPSAAKQVVQDIDYNNLSEVKSDEQSAAESNDHEPFEYYVDFDEPIYCAERDAEIAACLHR